MFGRSICGIILPLFALGHYAGSLSYAATIVTFDESVLPPGTAGTATANDQLPFVSHGVRFNRDWNSEFNCCPSGWAVSNQTDQTTPGPTSAYSAVVSSTRGGGHNSAQFAVANNLQRGEASVEFPQAVQVDGMYVTNATYTYLATVGGDDGAGFVKGPFAAGDWLRLEVVGLDQQRVETGRIPIYLVDYRDGLASALDKWTWFDLTPLGDNVSALEFEMSSTDTGPFGMNTPAFFAVDDLQFRLVPEPLGLTWLIASVLVSLHRCRTR